MTQDEIIDMAIQGHASTRDAIRWAMNQEQEQGEPVAFKIYKPTPPRHATPNVRDAELPWVYDQDPSSGNVASMWVTPVARMQANGPRNPSEEYKAQSSTPPQRIWVGLTDEEIGMAFRAVFPVGGVVFTNGATEFAQTIERRLKERNT